MNTIWGINVGTHDSSISVFNKKNDELDLVFAAHGERSSRIKNDKLLSHDVFQQAIAHNGARLPSEVVYYERDLYKRTRQLWARQWKTALRKPSVSSYLPKYVKDSIHYPYIGSHESSTEHHLSHAAAGYYTSPYRDAAVVVIDSIGEWATLTVWHGEGTKLKKVFSQSYPHSLGLWYSAMTQRIGLKPNEEEYILMGWAALGDPKRLHKEIYEDFFHPLKSSNTGFPSVQFKHNLHRGCRWWRPNLNKIKDYADIAAGTQLVYEYVFNHIIKETRKLVDSKNLVLMGGCALNCVANSIAHETYDGNVWIMPNPGDAGSSMGAVLAKYKTFIEWKGPYLGYNIRGDYPVKELLQELKTTRIAGVANGPAEFGPRALGNRTLFADPRGADVKDLVNTVKKRQAFRPFAPVILEQYANEYFDGPVGPYMQYTSKCRYPKEFPAIAHIDNTSRVQTVNKQQHPGLYELLEKWYKDTGCPMLLNTSLNIKGEPMVDTEADAERWQEKYKVKVFTKSN